MTAATPRAAYGRLAAQRGLLDRASRSVQISDLLRASILDGTFQPGSRLAEPEICAALDVSRNTLREAFRGLVEEGLATHRLNRGVFVRVPTVEDVRDLYGCRRVVECAAVHRVDPTPAALAGLDDALAAADAAAARGDWGAVGTEDVRFHRAVAALSGSRRLVELMESIWNEMRLVFHVVSDPERFHGPYLARNHAIRDALAAGDNDGAESLLEEYLADAEAHVLGGYPTT